MFSWFGHQSRFVLCMTGHLPALSSVFASMFLSKRVPLFPVPYTRIIGSWKVIQLHGPPNKKAGHAQYSDHGNALHNLKSELTMKEPPGPSRPVGTRFPPLLGYTGMINLRVSPVTFACELESCQPQPVSPVSVGYVRAARTRTTFPKVSAAPSSLWGAVF